MAKKAAHKPAWATRRPVKKSVFKKATPEERQELTDAEWNAKFAKTDENGEPLTPAIAAELLRAVPEESRDPNPAVVKKFAKDIEAGAYSFDKQFPQLAAKAAEEKTKHKIDAKVGNVPVDHKTAPTRRWVKKTAAGPHVMLKALAGTGKTFSQVEAACRLVYDKPSEGVVGSEEQEAYWAAVQTGEPLVELLAVAFNRSIAKTLEQRMPAKVTCKTMHGLGYSTLARGLNVKNFQVNEYKIDEVLEPYVCKPGQDLKAHRKERPMLLNSVRRLCDLTRQNMLGFDGAGVWHYDQIDQNDLLGLIDHYDVEVKDSELTEVLQYTIIGLQRCTEVTEVIDYCDMVWLPLSLGLPFKRFDALLGDEVQDWSRMMQEFARRSAGRQFLCGDENQAIYGFAGADSDSMPRMQRILEADKRGCMVMPLTETRRCGKAIVELAKTIVPGFRAHESNGVGEIAEVNETELWRCTKMTTEVVADMLDRSTPFDGKKQFEGPLTEAIFPGDMILCRMNAPLISACFRLLRMGVPATIQGRDIGVSLVRLLEQLTKINHASEYSTTVELTGWIDEWYYGERAKLEKKKFVSEAKMIALNDKHECLLEFSRDPECRTVADVKRKIERIFTDDIAEGTEHAKPKAKVLLSSVHRAKGLEADRVFIIAPEFMPHPMAKQEWELQQERNLKYVAITRAIKKLVWVTTSQKEGKRDE